MDFPCGRWDLDFSVVLPDFSAVARFVGTTNELEDAASRLLQRSVFAARLYFKFSAQRLRTLLPRASIRSGHPDFPRVISRTTDRPRNYNHWRHDILVGAICGVASGTTDMVDMGN